MAIDTDHSRGDPSPRRLDPDSIKTLRRFALTCAIIASWSMINWSRLPLGGLSSMMSVASMVSTLLAICFREPMRGPSLTRWDETLAYGAAAFLARAFS
jgi:hypothetical protein